MKHELSCNRTQRLLPLLPGNDLPPELDQPVRDHLARCTACQRRLGDQLRVRSLLGRLATPVRPDRVFFADLKGDILRRVKGDRVRHAAYVARISARRLSLARGMTAAALVLLAVYLIPQMLTGPETLGPNHRARGPVRSVGRDLPAVGLQGQEEILREVLILDGRLRPLERWPEPRATLRSQARSKARSGGAPEGPGQRSR